MCALAEAIRSRALGHLIEDVQSFARRRPALFPGAMSGGMAAERALRMARIDDDVQDRDQDGRGEDELSAALDALVRRMWPG